jgi:Pyruvate/2-oxoacid:ferredoxin oxidoreductase delta subunit
MTMHMLVNEPIEMIVKTAVELHDKGDKSATKANDFYKSCGIRVTQCWQYCQDNDLKWRSFCKENFPWSRRRADQLKMIGDGRRTIEEARENNKEANRRHRESRDSRNGTPVVEAESEDDCPECATPEEALRAGFLYAAKHAEGHANYHDLTDAVIDQEMVEAAQAAASAWVRRAAELKRRL